MKTLFVCMDENVIAFEIVTDGKTIMAMYADGSVRPITKQEHRIAMDAIYFNR